MQMHFKAWGSYSHSISCTGMCRCWGKGPVSVSWWHNPSQHLTEYTPPPPWPHKRKTDIMDNADIADYLGYSSSHMTSLTWHHWLKHRHAMPMTFFTPPVSPTLTPQPPPPPPITTKKILWLSTIKPGNDSAAWLRGVKETEESSLFHGSSKNTDKNK